MRDEPPAGASLTFLIGGARSGKSFHAETLTTAFSAPWTYMATAQAFDDEMRERIALHRTRRAEGWETIDAPFDLAAALARVPAGRPVLVDCLTLWLTNHMLADHDLEHEAGALSRRSPRRAGPGSSSPTRSASGSCRTTPWRGGSVMRPGGSTPRWQGRRPGALHGGRPADDGE